MIGVAEQTTQQARARMRARVKMNYPPLSAEDEEAILSLFDTDTEDESFHGFGEEEEKNAGSDYTDSLSIYRTHRLRTFREWTLTLTRLPVAGAVSVMFLCMFVFVIFVYFCSFSSFIFVIKFAC